MNDLRKEISEKKAEITGFATTGAQRVAAKDVHIQILRGPSVIIHGAVVQGLKHVDVEDRSAPVIESDVQLKHSPMTKLKKELTGATPELKHVGRAADDRSAPRVEAGVRVKPSPMLAKTELARAPPEKPVHTLRPAAMRKRFSASWLAARKLPTLGSHGPFLDSSRRMAM
jgi:hypothetical protein